MLCEPYCDMLAFSRSLAANRVLELYTKRLSEDSNL